jgi:hypothetical protein
MVGRSCGRRRQRKSAATIVATIIMANGLGVESIGLPAFRLNLSLK